MANKELAGKPMEARLYAWNDLDTPTDWSKFCYLNRPYFMGLLASAHTVKPPYKYDVTYRKLSYLIKQFYIK